MSDNFLIQALVYLGAALVCVPLIRRLGFSSVLGYLVAGVAIGPYILGWIGEEGQNIMHIAEFGVVMMLFLIGLELDPLQFWRMRRSILGLGGIQFGGTTLVLYLLGVWYGFFWQEALSIAMALSMSSTAMVLQTLQEKGLNHTAAGQSSFSVLLFQDIAVIPILALMPLLAIRAPAEGAPDGHTNLIAEFPQWLQTLVVIGAIGLVYGAGRYLVVPLLRVIARTNLRELFIAASLFLVIAVAVLMQLIGLSPALGAFLAGMVLANSEFRHELESDLLPFKSLLLGLFFIGVGCSINFGLLVESPKLIGVLLAVVLAVKIAVLIVSGRIFRLTTDQNMLFSFGLSQVGEFAFVLLSFSGELNLLSQEWLDNLMAVTTLSMATTPLLLLFNERIIAPRFGTKVQVASAADQAIDMRHEVIIAGFGHFGSTIGRFLRANGVESVVLDADSDRVDLLRKMGFKVYYGDATRVDLLQSAGAGEAKILIAAIDSPEVNGRLIETVRKHFPNLQILARARNSYDAYDMIDHGVDKIYRETFLTSVHLAVDVLKALGFRSYTATRQGQKFIRYDEAALRKLAAHRHDSQKYILDVRQEIELQEQQLVSDLQEFMAAEEHHWTVGRGQ